MLGQLGIGQALEDSLCSLKEAGPGYRPSAFPILMPFRHLFDRKALRLCNLKDGPRFPMNEFGTEFDRNINSRFANGEDSPANPVPRFENRDPEPRRAERSCCCQTSRTCADDQDLHVVTLDKMLWSRGCGRLLADNMNYNLVANRIFGAGGGPCPHVRAVR